MAIRWFSLVLLPSLILTGVAACSGSSVATTASGPADTNGGPKPEAGADTGVTEAGPDPAAPPTKDNDAGVAASADASTTNPPWTGPTPLCAPSVPELGSRLHLGDLILADPEVTLYDRLEPVPLVAQFRDPAQPGKWFTVDVEFLEVPRASKIYTLAPYGESPTRDSVGVIFREYQGIPGAFSFITRSVGGGPWCVPTVSVDVDPASGSIRVALDRVGTLYQEEPRALRTTFTWTPKASGADAGADAEARP